MKSIPKIFACTSNQYLILPYNTLLSHEDIAIETSKLQRGCGLCYLTNIDGIF